MMGGNVTKSKLLHLLAILVILEIGLVHYFNAQHEFEEAAVLGYLFVVNFMGGLLAAYGIYRRRAWGWGLGLFIAAASLAGYGWSRTTGLPGLEVEPWLSPWGVLSLGAEGLFVLLAFARRTGRPWRPVPTGTPPVAPLAAPAHRLGRFALPAAGLMALVLLNGTALRLDALSHDQDQAHIFSLPQVREAPVLSQQALEQQYGLQLSLVAVSSMGSIIDVRLKILDLEKAAPLLAEHSALLVGDTLILSPHQHRQPLKEGKAFIVFYPNQKHVVAPGTPVSLAFENIRMEPILAR
jgi:hypothetical protein